MANGFTVAYHFYSDMAEQNFTEFLKNKGVDYDVVEFSVHLYTDEYDNVAKDFGGEREWLA